MTRASLLHILNHVGAISAVEIRELEQLAAAFPYCQTAHLLLAKAAHDQGSMLASQRLRRAATYAVDRQLLRRLLEQPAPAAIAAPEMLAPKELAAPAENAAATSNSSAFFEALVTEDVQPVEMHEDEFATAAEEVFTTNTFQEAEPTVPQATSTEQQADLPGLEAASPEAEAADAGEQPEATDELTPALAAPEQAEAVSDEPGGQQAEREEVTTLAEPPAMDALPADSDELPAAPPPIRPPAEAGISRFEFGLSEREAPLVPIFYQLPGLEEDSDQAAEEENLPAASVTATVLVPPFRADTDLAYALLPGGSRYGYALQPRDEELTQPLPATEFFPPDALLQAHSTQPPSPAAPAPSSLDLINRFLKVQPRLKAPGVVPAVQEQTDLAARSTHAPPTLATESLAKILVRQGKTERAIEIYEQLMVRQPEKSAYFADQIQQLKTSE